MRESSRITGDFDFSFGVASMISAKTAAVDPFAAFQGRARAALINGSSGRSKRPPGAGSILDPNLNYSGPARNQSDLCRAFELVYQRYLAEGYMPPNDFKMRYSIFELLPVSSTYLACLGGEVCCTATVIADSAMGLPLSGVFSEELDSLRSAGRKVVEGSMLGALPRTKGNVRILEVMVHFISHCLSNEVDNILLVVNPKHVSFWQRSFGFVPWGNERPCAHVGGHPGVLLKLAVKEDWLNNLNSARLTKELISHAKQLASNFQPAYQLGEAEVFNLLLLNPAIQAGLSHVEAASLKRFYPLAYSLIKDRLGPLAAHRDT
jgi:hypothetical protein